MLVSGVQFEGRHKDGHAIPVELGVSKVLDEDRRVYVQIIRDLTERRVAEKQRQLQYEVARLLAGAASVSGIDDAVARATAYEATGVDALFFAGVKSRKELEAITAAR